MAQIYFLLQIGLSYNDIKIMPSSLADNLIKLHTEVKEKEAKDLERSSKMK